VVREKSHFKSNLLKERGDSNERQRKKKWRASAESKRLFKILKAILQKIKKYKFYGTVARGCRLYF
jgi:hypothetical protein